MVSMSLRAQGTYPEGTSVDASSAASELAAGKFQNYGMNTSADAVD
jgi:hypothetical protein